MTFSIKKTCQQPNEISSLSQVFPMNRIIKYCLSVSLVCNEDGSFRSHHQQISSNDSDMLPGTPFITVISVSIDDHFAVVNCSTKKRVPHHELEWYFRKSNSHKSPRVIWQRGRSNIHRYHAYSPDQLRHYLQIKPVQLNDSGSYICIDQMTGFQDTVELVVRKFNQLTSFIFSIDT